MPSMGLDQYRLLGRSGLRISPLTLGTMTFGKDWEWGSEKSESRAVLDAYLEAGGNAVDTANFYTNGTSEKFLGEMLGERRHGVVLMTKYTLCMHAGDPNAGGNHRKALVRSVEESLRRLNTDYIDLLWVHSWEFRTPVDEMMRALDDLVRAGKVLYVGMSNAPAWLVAQANTMADLRAWSAFVGLQIQYNLVQRDAERELIPMAQEFGIGVLPWSPLAGGILTGKYSKDEKSASGLDSSLRRERQQKGATPQVLAIADAVAAVAAEHKCAPAQVAIRWLLERPSVASPIIGARTLDQLRNNLAALDITLSDSQMEKLNDASAVDLGYPHTFLGGKMVRGFIDGGASIERR